MSKKPGYGEVMLTWGFSYDGFEKQVKIAAYAVQDVPDDDRTVSIDIDGKEEEAGFGLYLTRQQARGLARFLLLVTKARREDT